MRDGFIFYRSFYECSKALNNEQKLELYEAIFELALNQAETKTEPMVSAFLNLIKPQIEANNRRFENGKKGGRPANSEIKVKPNNNQTITKAKPKEKEKEKDNVKEKEKDKVEEKEFSFSLSRETSFDNLSLTYKERLKQEVDNLNLGMTFEDFVDALQLKNYKYKNFVLAYKNWCKKIPSQTNINGSKTSKVFVPNSLLGKVFYNRYNQKCEFRVDGFWNYEQDRLIWDSDTVNYYVKSYSDKNILREINASFKQI